MVLLKAGGALGLILALAAALPVDAQFTPAGQPPYPQQDPNAPSGANYPASPAPGSPNSEPIGPYGDTGNPDSANPGDAQHGVARISFVSGSVNVLRSGGFPVAAALNAPLMTQDHVQTGDRSSAELQVNGYDVLRIGQDADLGFADLQAVKFQAQLGAGTLVYSVLRSGPAQSEIDTPNIAFHALAPGNYRITVLSDGSTELSIRNGDAEILGPAGSQHLAAGHSYVVRGNAADPEFREVEPQVRDGFDDWSDSRNAALQNSQSAQYVGPDVPGTADLDSQGTWVSSPYGQVWAPAGVGPDWAPYSSGQWAYDNYYGYIWVDAAPWGWAPYHYGRWFHNAGYGWCWWPGPRVGFHVWSPALVGFFSFGGGYRGLGWVPLAPYERIHPWWGGQRFAGYGPGLGSFRNSAFRGAVSFAAYNHFAGPGQHFDHLGREQLAGARPLSGALPVAPNRAAYAFSNRPAYSNIRVNTLSSRQFASTQQFRPQVRNFENYSNPTQPRFNSPENRSAYPGNAGWSRLGSRGTRPATPGYGAAPTPRSTSSGWQHFGDPGGRTAPSLAPSFAGGPRTRADEGGWHSFGSPSPQANSYRQSYTAPHPLVQPPRSFSQPTPRYQSAPHYSAPSYSPPHNSAPHASYSAPAPHASGGGSHNGGGGHGRR